MNFIHEVYSFSTCNISGLKNNFIKKFCDKYHLTPIFYIGRRGQAGEKWDENWYDTFTELFNEHYDPIDEYDYYEEITMSGPFGEEYKD